MNPQQQAAETFPLADIAMQFLLKMEGEEPFVLSQQGPKARDLGLTALFSSGQAATPALNELLGLALVLDEEGGSPSAAREIRAAVKRDERALSALGISTLNPRKARRGSAHFTGGSTEQERAPVFGSAAPAGAKKAAAMIDPMALDRSRLGNKATILPKSAAPAPAPKPDAPKAPKARRRFDVG